MWEDLWVGDVNLVVQLPRVFDFETKKSLIEYFYKRTSGKLVWNLLFNKDLKNFEIDFSPNAL